MNESVLSVRNLSVEFATSHGLARVVDDISYDVFSGKTLGLVGESGSGKSVSSKAILGLLGQGPNVQISGSALLGQTELLELNERYMRRVRGGKIAVVLQDPMTSLNPVVKIGRQISEVIQLHLGLDRNSSKLRAIDLLRQVGLPDAERLYNNFPSQLSGGMRQRVAIAISLAGEPSLLIADEPTTALDVTMQAQILELLRDIQAERNMAMVLVSHDLGVIAQYADAVAVMYSGRIVEYLSSPQQLKAVHHPYTSALLEALPDFNKPPHSYLNSIQGFPPAPGDSSAGCRFAPRCIHVSERCHVERPNNNIVDYSSRAYQCWNPLNSERLKAL